MVILALQSPFRELKLRNLTIDSSSNDTFCCICFVVDIVPRFLGMIYLFLWTPGGEQEGN